MIKILTIIGARPQFIKAAVLSKEIKKNTNVTEIIIHTGQHYDRNMSDIFFEEMRIPKPNYYLGVGGKSHGAMTGQMIEKIEEVAEKERPDWILVYGDTNSTLAGAIVASKIGIKLAHVEAGLRSFNMKMPEEVNRIITDRLSTMLFCPSEKSIQNLYNEGFKDFNCLIKKTGDIMLDGINYYKGFMTKPESIHLKDRFVLCTIHRAENTDNEKRLKGIFDALNEIGRKIQIIIPLHPRTKKKIKEFNCDTDQLTIIDPKGYLNMLWLINNCQTVITDSGGLQKEAYFLNKHCITLRDETEWTELVDIGVNILSGPNKREIINAYNWFLDRDFPQEMRNVYGNGEAAKLILNELLSF